MLWALIALIAVSILITAWKETISILTAVIILCNGGYIAGFVCGLVLYGLLWLIQIGYKYGSKQN